MRRRHDLPITRFDCSTFVLHDLEYVKVSLVRSYHKNEPFAALVAEANQHGEDKSVLNTFEAHVCDQSLGERWWDGTECLTHVELDGQFLWHVFHQTKYGWLDQGEAQYLYGTGNSDEVDLALRGCFVESEACHEDQPTDDLYEGQYLYSNELVTSYEVATVNESSYERHDTKHYDHHLNVDLLVALLNLMCMTMLLHMSNQSSHVRKDWCHL